MLNFFVNSFRKNTTQLKNIFALAFNRGGSLVLQIIFVPVAIYLLGKNKYGEWLMLSAIPSYLMISDFGINITVTTSICSLVAKGNLKEATELHKSANTFVIIIGTIVLSFFLISSNYIHWNDILSLKIIDEFNTELTLFFLIISTFISITIGLLLGIYRAGGEFHLSEFFTAIYYMLDSVIFITIMYLSNSFIIVGLSQVIWRLIFVIFFSYRLSSINTWFDFGFSKNINPIIKILKTSIYYMAYIIGYGLVLQGTIILIGKNLGTPSLVTFNTTRTLVNSLRSLISIFYFSFLPQYTVLIAQNNLKRAKHLFVKMFNITLVISIFAVFVYYFLGDWIMYFWTKGKVTIEQPFYTVMLAMAFFSTLGNCAYTVLNATNENRTIGIYYTAIAILSMTIMFFWVKQGLVYVAFILLIIEFSILLIAFRGARKIVSSQLLTDSL